MDSSPQILYKIGLYQCTESKSLTSSDRNRMKNICALLPEEILTTVLVSWVELPDVVRADSAVCNRETRKHFEKAAYSHRLAYDNDYLTKKQEYPSDLLKLSTCWLLNRNCAMARIFIGAEKGFENVGSLYTLAAHVSLSFDYYGLHHFPGVTSVTCSLDKCNFYREVNLLCPRLQKIDLACWATDEDLECLAQNCPNLQSLRLLGIKITSEGWIKFLLRRGSNMTEIRGLYYDHDVCEVIAHYCLQLRKLDITHIQRTSPHALQSILQKCKQLTKFSFSCRALDSKLVNDVALRAEQLQYLSLDFSVCIVSYTEVVELIQRCHNLETLKLYGDTVMSDTVMAAIGHHCPKLVEIIACGAGHPTDTGVCALAQGCPLLRFVNVGYSFVTDVGVIALLTRCRNLEYLNLEGCDRITDNCLLRLPELCPFVIRLIVPACPRITVVGLRVIAQKCRHLRYVNVNRALVEEVRKAVAEAGLFRPGLKVSGW